MIDAHKWSFMALMCMDLEFQFENRHKYAQAQRTKILVLYGSRLSPLWLKVIEVIKNNAFSDTNLPK